MSMELREQPISQTEQATSGQITEQEQKVRLISRFIRTRVIGKNESLNAEEEQEIQAYYAGLSPREKADMLYGKVMAYMADAQAEGAGTPDPYLISEIKVLFGNTEVKKMLPSTYGEARLDTKKFRVSELGNLWKKTTEEIREKEAAYKQLERELHLHTISGVGKVSTARSRLARLAENITTLDARKRNIETLNLKDVPITAENTDTVAAFQYENLKEYKRQLDAGFVWLPSRKTIHQKTVSAILNHRWPVLIGEAGSGKSDQADAAALELTGHLPTEIECESTTGETQLIKDTAIDSTTGGSYDDYGPLMRAFTGYDDSRRGEPSVATGRIARFDESGRLGPKAYSIIKKARQKKAGEDFYGHEMLPGAGAIWTSNPVGPRYPDRHAPDPAMRRELAEIYVPYPEMNPENPELYEFTLAALQDENYHISIAKEELGPRYKKKEIPEAERIVLKDGSITIARDEIILNTADRRHGALWRFCSAINSLQDSFVYGNAESEKYTDTLLRFKEDADGNIGVTTDGSGEPLLLSTSTVTLGELKSWMQGFNERWQKQDAEFRVHTFTEWLNFKIKTYLEQADKADKEKLRAIFRHFGFLDKSVVTDIYDAQPLPPKEIGYLSPRVPRPLYLEKPTRAKAAPTTPEKGIAKEYETREVVLDDGSRVLMKVRGFEVEAGNFDLETKKLVISETVPGKRFQIKGEPFVFVGIVEDKNSPHNGQPIGQPASMEKLYKAFSPEELNRGIEEEFKNLIGETGVDDMKNNLLDYWEIEECHNKHGQFIF